MIALTSDTPLLRRFVVDLERTAPRALPARPELAAFARTDREAARFAWASRIVDEYRSVAVFSELLGLLADLEASFPAQCTVHRLIGDELRHTQATTEVVDWLGGCAGLAIDLANIALPPRAPGESPAVRALRIIGRELVVAEEESVYALTAYRDATTEPAIRAVLEGVLADEVRHAAAGRALYAELVVRLDDAGIAQLQATMRADRASLRADYRASAQGGAGRALGGSIVIADLEAVWRRVPGGALA